MLTHPALLARHSHASVSSPTLRGKFVRNTLLCQPIPAPPNDVGELPQPSAVAPTARDRLTEHRENPACAHCHTLMDPIGLAFENFDGIGAFRTTENDATIDPSGDLDGIPFADAAGLGEALANHPRLAPCFVRNLYRYMSGHLEVPGEEATLTRLTEDFENDGQLVRALLIEVVTSDGFRRAGEPE